MYIILIFTVLGAITGSCALFLLFEIVPELREDLDHEISLRRDLELKNLRLRDDVDRNTLKIIDLTDRIKKLEKKCTTK
jgi:hypothetical protein